jgi:hypothetical protein
LGIFACWCLTLIYMRSWVAERLTRSCFLQLSWDLLIWLLCVILSVCRRTAYFLLVYTVRCLSKTWHHFDICNIIGHSISSNRLISCSVMPPINSVTQVYWWSRSQVEFTQLWYSYGLLHASFLNRGLRFASFKFTDNPSKAQGKNSAYDFAHKNSVFINRAFPPLNTFLLLLLLLHRALTSSLRFLNLV